MNGIKRAGIIGAVAIGLVAGFLMVMQAWAASGSLSAGNGSAAPGGSGSVDVTASVEDPGLGAWTIDVVYDPEVVTATGCESHSAGVCNENYEDSGDTVRLTGAVATGIDEETVLGSIEFQCGDAEGTSDLTIMVSVFADATIGDPQDVDPLDVSNGSFACEEAEPTPTTGVVETEEPTGLPPTGQGLGGTTGGGNGAIGWIIVALAAAGVVGIAGFGALRARARS